MAEPIVPTWRLTFPYTVALFPHVMHFYTDVVASADPSGYSADQRGGGFIVGVSTIPAPWWTKLAPNYSAADALFGNAHLDHFVGGVWIPVWYEANAVVPSSGSPTQQAAEMTISGYASDHDRMKTILMEHVFGGAFREATYAAVTSALKPIVNALYNSAGTAVLADPYNWAQSKSGKYATTFISLVGTYSKHWRRKRGLG